MAAHTTFRLHKQPLIICIHLLLLSSCFFSSYALPETEALLKFKSSLSNSASLVDWTNDKPPCDGRTPNWVGVTCNKGSVSVISLGNKGLSGTIDLDALSGMPNLKFLGLQGNAFEGPLPQLKKLKALKGIFLSNNRFSGEIPGDAFEGMTGLKKLDLSNNKFTGPIPASLAALGSQLVELKLDGNQFSGQIPESLNKLDASIFAGNQGLCGQPLEPCGNPPTGPSATTPNSAPAKKASTWIIVIISIIAVFIILTVLAVVIMSNRSNKQPRPLAAEATPSNLEVKAGFQDEEQGGSSTHSRAGKKPEPSTKLSFVRDDRGSFDLTDLLKASAQILGSGCFGSSYKTVLPSGNEMVVKRYKQMNNMGKQDFQDYIKRLGLLAHVNILPIVAYYYKREEKLIVSDFVKRGSLAVHLHGYQSLGVPALDWPTRLKIVKGVAKGLSCLYKELPSLVAPHGHLKSSNVLLNESYEPIITDYGLIPVINQENAQELMVAYKSPEYVQHGRITKKTDVWALGVLVLEMLTGKFPANYLQNGKGNEDQDLPSWVKSVVGEEVTSETTKEVFDKDMGAKDDSTEGELLKLLKIGLSCCEVDVDKRLDMKEAIGRIEELKEKEGDDDFYSSVASEADKRSSRAISDDFTF